MKAHVAKKKRSQKGEPRAEVCHPDEACPTCHVKLVPEHAHQRCPKCGYRDGCCW